MASVLGRRVLLPLAVPGIRQLPQELGYRCRVVELARSRLLREISGHQSVIFGRSLALSREASEMSFPDKQTCLKITGEAVSGKTPKPRARHTVSLGLTKASSVLIPQMGLTAPKQAETDYSGDILFYGTWEGVEISSLSAHLDKSIATLLTELASEDDEFTAKPGQVKFIRLTGQKFKWLGLIGLGKIPEEGSTPFAPANWKAAGASIAALAKQVKASTAGLAILGASSLIRTNEEAAAGALVTGVMLASYEDTRFKSESKPLSYLKELQLFGMDGGSQFEAAVARAQNVSIGIITAMQLVNAPPNVLTPGAMAEAALSMAKTHSDVLTAKILEQKDCEKLGMGAYLGVAAASTNPPKFIHLTYTPVDTVKRSIAIVGKGLTFDSGGYNLKAGPGSMIEMMKFDMGGAGATLGAARAIAAIRPSGIQVHFVVAACENMISGSGMRPGDILTASNGKTIEVNNTDAEGRLTLADALVYVCNLDVEAVVDLATLTGACIVALGNDIAGLFTPDEEMAVALDSASKSAGELLWRMPMEASYWEGMKSKIADMVNTGGRPGGAITAALFLKEFVKEGVKWAHVDIAGPAWSSKKGCATGFPVETLVTWVEANSSR